jgi:hypothetical protein
MREVQCTFTYLVPTLVSWSVLLWGGKTVQTSLKRVQNITPICLLWLVSIHNELMINFCQKHPLTSFQNFLKFLYYYIVYNMFLSLLTHYKKTKQGFFGYRNSNNSHAVINSKNKKFTLFLLKLFSC